MVDPVVRHPLHHITVEEVVTQQPVTHHPIPLEVIRLLVVIWGVAVDQLSNTIARDTNSHIE